MVSAAQRAAETIYIKNELNLSLRTLKDILHF